MWEFDVCVILLWHRIEILVMLLKNCRKNSIDLTEFYTHNPIHAILSFSNKQHPTNAVTRYNNTSCLLADQVGGGILMMNNALIVKENSSVFSHCFNSIVHSLVSEKLVSSTANSLGFWVIAIDPQFVTCYVFKEILHS